MRWMFTRCGKSGKLLGCWQRGDIWVVRLRGDFNAEYTEFAEGTEEREDEDRELELSWPVGWASDEMITINGSTGYTKCQVLLWYRSNGLWKNSGSRRPCIADASP